MATKTFLLKADFVGTDAGPFDVKDNLGNVIATGITRDQLLAGVDIQIDETATSITLSQNAICVSDTVVPMEFIDCDITAATIELCDLASSTFLNIFPEPNTCPDATVCISSLSNTTIGNLYPSSINGATDCVESLGGILIGYGH